MGSTLCRCRKNKVASSMPPSEKVKKDSDEIINDHHSTILSASFGGDAYEIQHNQEANSVSWLEGKRNGETSPENEREDSDEMLSDHHSTISSASFRGDVNEIQQNQEANSVSRLEGKSNGETLPENKREGSDEMFSDHHSTISSASFGGDVNEIGHHHEANLVSGLESKRNGETSPENEREDVGRRLSDHDSVESVSNGQAGHINSGTESGQEGAVDSSTNVSQEEHASLDENFLYSKNVIVVRSFEEAYDKGSSSDVNSICSEDNGGHSYESSICLGNEGPDKIPGDEVVHKEDVLEKSASAEDFKATSSDEDGISIIDCPSCEISTNIDQVKNESIQDDAPLAVHHLEDNTGFPINVKQSLPSVRVSGIGNRDQPEDDINSNGCLQNHKNVARMYSNNHSNSNSSIGVEVISSGTAARSGDAEFSKNDSAHNCDRCSGGDYSLVVPFADESDDIYLHDRGDGNLGIITAFGSGNGEAECTDADAGPGREDKADAGRTDSENGVLGGTNFRSCGCDDEVTDDDDFGILGKYDDSHSHVRVLNDDDNDHNKKDNDDSDEDEPDNSGKDNNKNSDKNGTHDDANAKDDGGDQFFEQGDDAGILFKQQETLSEKQSTPQIPFPVDVDVMEYISASKYQALFQSFLEDKGIIFNWKEGSIAYIECYGHANDAVKALNSFFLDFKTQDISVKEEVWNCVVAKISTFCSHLGDNPPLIKVVEDQMKLRIVSFKQNIDHYEKRLKDWLKKLKKETSLERRTFSKCSKDDILLLKKINFKDNYLGKDCKDVEMAFDLENVEIRMKGPTLQLDIVMERLQEQEIATEEKPLRLPQSILEFLKTDKGQEAIDKTLEQHQIEAIVLFDDPSPSKQLSARVRGYAIEAIPHIHNIAVDKEKTVEESNVRLTATPDWAELCSKVRIEQGVFIRSNDSGRIWITGFEKNVEKAAERLQEFLDANSIEKEEYMCPSREARKYIKVHCVEDLNTMTRDLREFEVKFLPRDDDRAIYMSGRRKGLDKAKDCLDKLVNSFVVRRLERRQPGLQKYFEMDGIGHRRIELLEHDQKCLIRIERDFDHQRDSHCYFVTAQAHMISWKIGDIAKEQVHTLVSPQGACTDALLNSNPWVPPQVSARVKAGEISVLSASGVYLPWSHIFFTNCSNWNGGKGEECLKTIVKTSLQRVESLNGNSVAFPAIGTGNLHFPPKQAARIMLDETAKFCQENPTSDLKDIRFILLGRDKMVIDAFSQEMVNLQKNFSGLSPPQTGEETWCKNVKIAQGDLTKEFQSEAILNVIGSDVNITRAGSISERVFRAAGSHLEQEFRQLHDRSQRPKALMTSGGNLSSSHIIHTIPSSSDKREIKKSLEKGLLLAKQNNIPSISLPAVGTGGHGLSPSDSAKLIFQTLKSVWGNCANFPSVRIVLLQSPELMRAFELEKKGQLAPQHQEGSRRKTKMGRINIEVEGVI